MARRRFQAGSLRKTPDGYWRAFYREYGPEGAKQKTKILGRTDRVTKAQAKEKLADILTMVNRVQVGPDVTVKAFVENVFKPVKQRRWKTSTKHTTLDRIDGNIVKLFGHRELRTVSREELQDFLDDRKHLSFSTVDHLRWDLRDIFTLAVSERVVQRNTAEFLSTPRDCRKANVRTLTTEQVKAIFGALGLRERVILKLAIEVGMRPGEIFAVRVGSLDGADIKEGVYRGVIDTPKTQESTRVAALPQGLRDDIEAYLKVCPAEGPESWLFPSEKLKIPVRKDNLWRRHIKPVLEGLGLGWVNFQVCRSTHASLMRQLRRRPETRGGSARARFGLEPECLQEIHT